MDRKSKIIFIAFVIILAMGILIALSADTDIKGGYIKLIATDTLIAADSSKSPYLELWGDYLEGSAVFDVNVDSIDGTMNWTIYYAYGNDTTRMNYIILLDSVETELDTIYIHQTVAARYLQFIMYSNLSAGDSISGGLGANFIPLRSRAR